MASPISPSSRAMAARFLEVAARRTGLGTGSSRDSEKLVVRSRTGLGTGSLSET